MGIEDRTYYRDSGQGVFEGRDAVKLLIVANVVAYVVQIVWTMPDGGSVLEYWFRLDPRKVLQGQIWRLTTYDFLHNRLSAWHLFFNMYALYLAGRKLQDRYGFREFLAFYLVAGIASGLAFVGVSYALGQPNPAVGASGAVVASIILYALHWPDDEWIILIFPLKMKWIALLTVIFDLHPVLLQISGVPNSDGIAHACHLGGIAFGYLYFRANLRITMLWDDIRLGLKRKMRVMTGPKLTIHRDDSEDAEPVSRGTTDSRVDALLAKIHEHGEASLTPQERQYLEDASRRMRRRRGSS